MTPVEKPIYDFYRKFNAVNSGTNKKINIVDLIAYLNEALEIWFVNMVFNAEENSEHRNVLRRFEVKKKGLEIERIDENCVVAKYPDNYYRQLNQVAIASSDCCEDKKEIVVRIVQSDDLQEARRNPYRDTNFKWERILADEGEKGLYLYEDKKLLVEKVYIDYFRRPNFMEAGELLECGLKSYINYGGETIKLNKDLEVEGTFSDRQISDIAVLLVSRDVKDLAGFQSQLQKILQVEKLYKS